MSQTELNTLALRIEGGLLPAEFIQTLLELKAERQSAVDYGILPGLNLKDEIGRYWRIATALWTNYRQRLSKPDANQDRVTLEHWLLPLFTQVLGYEGIARVQGLQVGERLFPVTHRYGSTPLTFMGESISLDKREARFAPEGRKRSAHATMQEYLNASQEAQWGLATNGLTLRVLRDNPSMTRPAYIEVALDRIFEEERYADFVAFWLIMHSTRFGNSTETHGEHIPVIELWHGQAQSIGERALANLRDGVTEALRQFGNGFIAHLGNSALRARVTDGSLTEEEFYRQLLRLIYRLILLFTAEDRGILLSPDSTEQQRALYANGYGTALLRNRVLKPRADRHADLWQGLLVTFRALGTGAEPLGLPALGGIFSADRCPDLDTAELPNTALLAGLRSLSFFRSGTALSRINYRDMDTEELGSVYESLLELQPRITVETNPWQFGFAGDIDETGDSRGSARRLTGSYYTPDDLVQELIGTALEPKIAVALKTSDPRQALLSLKVVDPASGSGHFLLAAARRIAAEVSRIDAENELAESVAFRHAMREVVARCIYGVDLNPLAVELCKAALWLETLEPGKPLGFLDHHIRHGNSLVGILDSSIMAGGIPDKAYELLSGDDREACNSLKRLNRSQMNGRQTDLFFSGSSAEAADTVATLEAMPEDTVGAIEAKRKAFARYEKDERFARERFRFDLFCSAFFAAKTSASMQMVPLSDDLGNAGVGLAPRSGVAELARELAGTFNFFHWQLAFPEVFAQGGFDVVLANPPWEVSQLSEEEFFTACSHPIGTMTGNARKQAIQLLETTDVPLWHKFLKAKRRYEGTNNFARFAERFPLTASGKVNLYALFAECISQLIGDNGRAGMIVPSGIATDDSTKAFFDSIATNGRIASLYDFENREKLFPAVDSRMKFCALTLGRQEQARFVFFATRTSHLREDRRAFNLSAEDISLLNPNTKTCPVFRSQADAELTKKIYRRVPVLIEEGKGDAGNPWKISFRQGLFNMTSDSHLFSTAIEMRASGAQRNGANWIDIDGDLWVPLYEAKMVHQFDHRWAMYEENGEDSRDLTDAEKQDASMTAQPRYWIKESEVNAKLAGRCDRQWLMGWRDITNATNERTVIAGVIPRVGVGNNMPLWFLDQQHGPRHSATLLANFCALTLDFTARHKVGGTHLNFFIFKQLPILPPSRYSTEDLDFIVPRVLELTYTAHDLSPFARDLGYNGPPFSWNTERRALLRAELDAWYAKLYGLTRDELRYILDPSDVYGEDYPSETFRVLKKNETNQFGEYRTRRLVLEAWDRLCQAPESCH
ncbi:MAG: N-6 DNA methylase [Chlorobiaceae bacterium]|nr:N-6 DNA methylase [Chlorobiaceae bacterium]